MKSIFREALRAHIINTSLHNPREPRRWLATTLTILMLAGALALFAMS